MKRRLLNLLTVLSLLICVAVMALWVRSLWIGDMVTWLACRDGTRITFASVDAHAGAVVLAATTWTLPADAPAPSVQGLSEFSSRESRSYQAPVSTFREQNLRPDLVHESGSTHYGTPVEGWGIVVPYWLPTLLALILPTYHVAGRVRSRRRRQRGRCVHCGYDLRASLGRCPECGSNSGVTQRA